MTLPTYLTYPVLNWEPDWSDPTPVTTLLQRKTRWDNRAGLVRDDAPDVPGPRTERRMRYILGSRQEIRDALDFILETAQGRLKPFWVPTWTDDVQLTAGALSTDDVLLMTKINYTRFMAGQGRGRTQLALFPRAAPGTIVYREIIASEVLGYNEESLTLDADLGVALNVEDRVCFLLLCRLADDDVVLHRTSWDTAVLELPIIDLPWETSP